MKLPILVLSLLAAVPAAAPPAQEPQGSEARTKTAQEAYSMDELVLRYFDPVHHHGRALAGVAQSFFGRTLLVEEEGGTTRAAANLAVLDRRLVVLETIANAERILAFLREADGPPEGSAGSDLETFEYAPRFVGLDALREGLGPYRHEIAVAPGEEADNVTLVRGRNLLVVRDTPERLAEIRHLLGRIDVPPPQVLVRCHLLGEAQASAEADPRVPAELAEHLARLVPGRRFEEVGFALLRTTVDPQRVHVVNLGRNGLFTWSLDFVPKAFDPETDSLSLSPCKLVERTSRDDGDPRSLPVFETSLVLTANEWTVLGASATTPLFVALRLEPID